MEITVVVSKVNISIILDIWLFAVEWFQGVEFIATEVFGSSGKTKEGHCPLKAKERWRANGAADRGGSVLYYER